MGLPGDTKLTIQMLIEEVKAQLGPNGRKGKTTVAPIASIKQQWMSEWTDILRSDDVPINTYRVIGELERILDKENSIVTHDAGAPRDSIMPFYTATIPHSYIGWGKTTHLGYGIPLMIGTKLANLNSVSTSWATAPLACPVWISKRPCALVRRSRPSS